MSEPTSPRDDQAKPALAFISHFRVKAGHAAAFQGMWASVAAELESDKPRTSAYLAFLTDDAASLTIVHVFPDADAMGAHFAGANLRAAAAYEHIEPAGWEVYGRPHAADLDHLRAASQRAGVPLVWEPAALGGFLRLAAR